MNPSDVAGRPAATCSALPASPGATAEAARYALLRRLAPSFRHHLVVNLQPIGMVHEVMDRRLRAAQPDLDGVRDAARKINGFARSALDASLDVVGWLAPDRAASIGLQEGVRDVARLLQSSLSFRGYGLRDEVGAEPGLLRRCALRNLLSATLLHATDVASAPAELLLSSESAAGVARLRLRVRQHAGEGGFASEPVYRALGWDDVRALAAAEEVEAVAARAGEFELRFPVLSPPQLAA